MTRQCGSCTLCCKLLPVRELGKGAGERCRHQCAKGCRVYASEAMPPACRLWSCAWLVGGELTRGLGRPDRTRYVVDILPDFVETSDEPNGVRTRVNVVQVWVDPKEPDAWRDPALLAFLELRGHEGLAAIIRFSAREAIVAFPPAMMVDGKWHETPTAMGCVEHSAEEIWTGLN